MVNNFSSYYCTGYNNPTLTRRLALVRFGVVGLLEFGVVERVLLGVVGLLAREPDRKSGNRCGETVRLSVHSKYIIIRMSHINMKVPMSYDQDVNSPDSFLGMVDVNEKTAGF